MKKAYQRTVALFLSVLMLVGLAVTFTLPSSAAIQARYSDLFFVYDSKYLKSEALKTYYRETGTVMQQVLYDFYDSPVDMFLLELKTAINSFGFVDYAKLMSSAYGDTDFYYQAALDAVNLKLVEALSDNQHEDAFNVGSKAVKQMKSIGSFNKDFHEMFDGKTSTSLEQFNSFGEFVKEGEFVAKIPNNTVAKIFDEVGKNLSKYKKVIGTTATVLEICDAISVGLALEEVKREFIDDILEETNTDSLINSDLRRGMLRLKSQMDVGFVNYFVTNYLLNKGVYLLIKKLGEEAINDSIPLYGMAVEALQVLSKIVFDYILDTPGLDDYANLIVATKYTEDLWAILKNKQAKLNTHVSAEEVEKYKAVFCAMSAANDITMDYSKSFTLGKNKDAFNQMCSTYKGYTYDKYIADTLSELNAISFDQRSFNRTRVFDHYCGTQDKGSSDTIENGCLYTNDGTPYVALRYHHNKNQYVYFWAAHPHYKCYRCSCGFIWEDRNELTAWENCSICLQQGVATSTGSGVKDKLNSLRLKFKEGEYWNHLVTEDKYNGDQLMARWDESFANTTTTHPCATHNGTAAVGQYDCNFFDGGIQCWGFACKVFYDVFGQRVSNSTKNYSDKNVMVGDYVRVNNDTHSGVVLTRNGNTITLVECNFITNNGSGNCIIHWGTIDYNINSINYYVHASNYNQINGIEQNTIPEAETKYTITFDPTGGTLPGDTTVSYQVTTSDGLNVRSGAGTNYSIIGTMPIDTFFDVVDTMYDGMYLWGKHAYNGSVGWSVINIPGWATETHTNFSPYSQKVVTNNNAYGNLPIPSKESSLFAGWYNSVSYDTLITASTTVSLSSDQTLYARWISPESILPGTYVIKQLSSGGYINDAYANDEEGNFIGMYSAYNMSDNAQQMILVKTEAGYKINPMCSTSGRILSVKSNSMTTGNNVVLNTDADLLSQQWYFEGVDNGFVIRSAQDTNFVLDGQGMNYSCVVKNYNGANSQIWQLYSLIRFDANEGTGAPADQLKLYGDQLVISSTIPVRSGYKFFGWTDNLDDQTNVYNPGDQYCAEGAKTLYAIWVPDGDAVVELRVEELPDRTYFEPGEAFDFSGLKIRVIRADGTESVVDDITNVAGYSPFKVGEQTITIGYEGRVAQYLVVVANRGDLNHDQMLNISDVTELLNLLANDNSYVGVADLTHDSVINISDVTELLNALAAPAEWIKASSLPAGAQVLDRKWTYTRTQVKDSLDGNEEGWEHTEVSWEEVGSGTYQYAVFPSTFSKSHSLYNAYNKEKLTGYSENGITRVVSDPVLKSYIYWHWCYESGTTTTFNRVISDQYHTYLDTVGKYTDYFYAFDTTTNHPWVGNAGAFKAEISGMNASSYWWFRFNTYTQTYTDYRAVYQYQKITQEESDTEVFEGGEISDVVEWVKYAGSDQLRDYTYNVVYVSSNGTDLGSTSVTNTSGTTATIVAPEKVGYITPASQEVVWDTEEKTVTFVYVPEQITVTKTGQFCNPPDERFSITYNCQNRTETSVDVVVTMTLTINNPNLSAYNTYSHWFATSVNGNSTGVNQIVPFGAWQSVSYDSRTVTKTITVPLTTTEKTSASVVLEIWMQNYQGNRYGDVDRYTWTIDLPAF